MLRKTAWGTRQTPAVLAPALQRPLCKGGVCSSFALLSPRSRDPALPPKLVCPGPAPANHLSQALPERGLVITVPRVPDDGSGQHQVPGCLYAGPLSPYALAYASAPDGFYCCYPGPSKGCPWTPAALQGAASLTKGVKSTACRVDGLLCRPVLRFHPISPGADRLRSPQVCLPGPWGGFWGPSEPSSGSSRAAEDRTTRPH